MSILFDLDGTLLDTSLDFFPAINALRTEMHLPPLPESMLPQIRFAVSEGIEKLVEVGFNSVLDPQKATCLQKTLLDSYLNYLGEAAKPFPGIESLLQTLERRQIPWGIVTNKVQRFTEPLLEKLRLKHRAACIVSGDTTPYAKPHPAPLLHASQQIGYLPEHCLYIGDHERDILAGNAAGMKTIGALFGYVKDKEAAKQWGADHYVNHADEILPWYEAWQNTAKR